MVVNLLPPLHINKGSAVRRLVRDHRLRAVAYFGDDLTDTHAFRALAAMRRRGQARTLSIAVLAPETPARVRRLADATVGSVEAATGLLAELADRLGVSQAERAERLAGAEGARARMGNEAPRVRGEEQHGD
jgi:trehalose 6-phosphate phosphatase